MAILWTPFALSYNQKSTGKIKENIQRMLKKIINLIKLKKPASMAKLHYLEANVLEVRDLEMLSKAMGWKKEPILNDDSLYKFNYLEDLNNRRLRDAEVIHSACANAEAKVILEIGTATGRTTALMATNAPDATIYTVNIPPEEIKEGGVYVTYAPEKEEIGHVYREKGLPNIKQIYANTATWEPNIGIIDVAFIDGSHDANFIYNDTKKILKNCKSGSLILWHDFNPSLMKVYPWISDVCKGIEMLYRDKIIKGRILHLQDSWVGLYKVP